MLDFFYFLFYANEKEEEEDEEEDNVPNQLGDLARRRRSINVVRFNGCHINGNKLTVKC